MQALRAESPVCLHCGRSSLAGSSFCCAGCESVHGLLIRRGLAHFYDMRDQGTLRVAPPAPVVTAEDLSLPSSQTRARFYIEGIHCLGCLWLLEKLPEIDTRIAGASLDYANGILEVRRREEMPWADVSKLIRELGYVPRPLSADEGAEDRKREMKAQATRLGVAAFSAGNIMLLSVSLYAGADGLLATHFQALSLLLSLPALGYSAFPLYRSAWVPLRHGRASVDLAISLALLAGFGLSVFSMVRGGGETYFDSLTMLVFLLLASRFFLNRFRESLAKQTPCLSFLSQHRYERTAPSAGTVKAEDLASGDRIVARAGQPLPTDCRLESAAAYFDLSLLTGESAPVKMLRGDAVEAGSRAIAGSTELSVLRPANRSRLAQILQQIKAFQLSRTPSLDFADRIGRRFVGVVLTLAAGACLWLPFPEGIHRALVLVIVTCPCVLAFAVPLAFTRALQLAARGGILFKETDKIEELASARTVFLDKTGTLTEGNFEVLEWDALLGDQRVAREAVLALESHSEHPVAKALVRYLGSERAAAVEGFREIPGYGVTGRIAGRTWEVTRLDGVATDYNVVGVYRDGLPVANVSLGDRLRPEAAGFVQELQALGLKPVILSGDTERRVSAAARALGITEWKSRLSPEQKAEVVRATPSSLMVGDGANDAVAFRAARVGIAVRGAMDLSLQNADVALATPGLDGALRALRLSRRAMRVVRANFGISLGYNLLAGAIALAGGMSPLLAAVLMPLSALSVFAFTQATTGGDQR